MKAFLNSLLILVSILYLGSCKKYEDGPRFSLRSKHARVEGKWKLEKRFVNDSEEELTSDDRDDRLEFKKDDTFIFEDPGNQTINGMWEFDANKENLILNYTVEVVDVNGNIVPTQIQEIVEILRLKNNELWVRQPIDGEVIESHYIPA